MQSQSNLAEPDRWARWNASACVLFMLLISIDLADPVDAQVGNQNPSGPSGIFNGQVNTGCSYDSYTGNAMRAISDIIVAGAVGEYPLALVRTANSRTPSTSEVFGYGGGWNHNYNWTMEDSGVGYAQNFPPTQYIVNFPDGRVEMFKHVTWDSAYRVRLGTDGSAGVRERFVQLNTNPNNPDYMLAYLILPDGGKIKFHATQHNYQGQYHYTYKATTIIDPHGLQTILTWETVNGRNRLTRVQEPAGRYLQITYSGNGPRISQVQEFINGVAGRSVQYYYLYTMLDHVAYYGNPDWTAHYQYTAANTDPDLPPLLWTCDDPMYPGPMKRIAYEYQAGTNADGTEAVYGQILRERYWDGVSGHEGSGAFVSELNVGAAPSNHNVRIEKRGDNVTRSFTYTTAGYLTSCTDFMNRGASQTYDAYKWINSVTDRNGHRTDFTSDTVTGNVMQVQFPLTPGDTPGQGNTRPTVNYTYTNNYYLHTVQDEGGNTTTVTRDSGSNRITRIDYPDGGYETFAYDSAHFYQLSSHRMVTGGTESFAYDGFHQLQYYSDPYHSNPDDFSIRYYYDTLGRVNGVFDTLWHPTNWDYNSRGQVTVTTLSTDPVDNQRHTIVNAYNPDGTLQSRTNELGYTISYTYDDYRRVKTVSSPDRGDGAGTHTTFFYYDANGSGDDYRFTDSSLTYITLPSGKRTKTGYDDNRRKTSVTFGYGTADAATTSCEYDDVGNVTSVTNPRNKTTDIAYDERNRPSSITDANSKTTIFTYDIAGRKKTMTRPNGQLIMYVGYDAMNRVLSQSATNAGTTNYTYYTPADGPNAPVGLLKTIQDPHLVAIDSSDTYTYGYDLMGRRTSVTYPLDSNSVHRTEYFTYDAVGRLQTFKNRDNPAKTQTFTYDALNRMIGFTWDDGGITPSVSFGYDAASRLSNINNANATISRAYWNDNSLHSETETTTGGVARTVSYFYDADGNRAGDANHAGLRIPGYSFTYTYTNRNQLNQIKSGNTALVTYVYDQNGYKGDLTTRTLANNTSTTYQYDVLDRVTRIAHSLAPRNTRTLDYDYDSVGNRKWAKRDGGNGDVFGYDFNDQVTAVKLNIANPDRTPVGGPTISYDDSGNRIQFFPYGPVENYTVNNLSQYISRNNVNAIYDPKGNLADGFDGSTYQCDAQNRLTQASKGSVTITFAYDGLNRQVKRTVSGQAPTYSVWDGWDLVQEYHMYRNNVVEDASYLYGATGVVKNLKSGNYYYQTARGSTSHLTDASGQLLEWYRYDLQGTPVFYDPSNNQRTSSAYGVRHLFTGQQWYQELGLYDLRNRFYSPELGRFLQSDPIGFRGDRTNLYRYCGNNPVTRWDPFGLQQNTRDEGGVVVTGSPVDNPVIARILEGIPSFGGPGGLPGGFPFDAPEDLSGFTFIAFKHGAAHQGNGQHQSTLPSTPPPQNSQAIIEQAIIDSIDFSHMTTAEFIMAGNIIEHGDTTDTRPAFDLTDLLSGGIAALARSSVRSVAQRAAVFWAGGRTAENAARTFATANGGVVLADTPAGRALAKSAANLLSSQERAQWRSLSEDFARSASGEVSVFQNSLGVPLDSIWRNEYQILIRNPNVTGINFSVVMPDGSVVPVP